MKSAENLKNEKHNLEKSIKQLISDFSERNGHCELDIMIEYEYVHGLGSYGRKLVDTSVKIKVSIPYEK